MKKDKEWLKEALLELRSAGKPENNWTDEGRDLRRAQQWAWNNCIDRAYELANQLDEPETLSEEWIERNTRPIDYEGRLYVWKSDLQNLLGLRHEEISSSKQIDKLAKFIMSEVEGEPSQSQGAVDAAIRIIKSYQNQETLSQDWINKHSYAVAYDGMPDDTEIVYVDDLQNLLVPEQKELEVKIQELIERYEKEGGRHSNPENAWIREFITDLESLIENKEKEPKYYVDLDTAAYVAKWVRDGSVQIYTDSISGSDEYELHLTEQEIKDYDPRFWLFAIKVEELK